MEAGKQTRTQRALKSKWYSRLLTELFQLNTEADMAMIEMMCEITNPMKLEVVWRNPRVVRAGRVRHASAPALGRGRYVVQEYDGSCGFWRTISDLEVVVGGRAA